MKSNYLMVYMLMGLIVVSTGCQKQSHQRFLMTPAAKPGIEYVQNPQLAEMILKPKGKQLLVSRDPFKPIFTKEEMGYPDFMDVATNQGPNLSTNDIVLVGVARMDHEYQALIKYHDKSGVFKVEDKVENYVIKDINLDRIVLTDGNQDIIKKRGEI